MKVIKEGYQYGLHNVENPQVRGQIIQFIEIEQTDKLTKTINNGVSLVEYLEVALAKAKFDYEQTKIGGKGIAMSIYKIEEAILWLENKRT